MNVKIALLISLIFLISRSGLLLAQPQLSRRSANTPTELKQDIEFWTLQEFRMEQAYSAKRRLSATEKAIARAQQKEDSLTQRWALYKQLAGRYSPVTPASFRDSLSKYTQAYLEARKERLKLEMSRDQSILNSLDRLLLKDTVLYHGVPKK